MAKHPTNPKVFRICVLGSGTVLAALYILVYGPKLVSLIAGTAPSLPEGRQWEEHAMTALFLIFMVGFALGWRNRLWGGVVMVLASAVNTIPFVIIQGNFETPAIFASPVFAVGALYLLLHREEARFNRSAAESLGENQSA